MEDGETNHFCYATHNASVVKQQLTQPHSVVGREEDSQISLDVECRSTKAVTSCYGGIVHIYACM